MASQPLGNLVKVLQKISSKKYDFTNKNSKNTVSSKTTLNGSKSFNKELRANTFFSYGGILTSSTHTENALT